MVFEWQNNRVGRSFKSAFIDCFDHIFKGDRLAPSKAVVDDWSTLTFPAIKFNAPATTEQNLTIHLSCRPTAVLGACQCTKFKNQVGVAKDITNGAGSVRYPGRANRTLSAKARRCSCAVQALTWRIVPATRYMLRRNTASIMKIWFCYDLHYTRVYTPKPATSDRVHLFGLAPG